MKTIIKQLQFDKDLVNYIQAVRVNPDFLYSELMNGRLTLQEYFAAIRKRH